MGIPAYFSHIVKKYRSIIKPFNSNDLKIHNLYMDCNSVIYDSVKQLYYHPSQNESEYHKQIINLVCLKLNEYITNINPLNKVIIAFDGVAPVAKLEQQRNRRYKSWFTNMMMNRLTSKEIGWDTSNITPGTVFMDKLGKAVSNHFSLSNKASQKLNIPEIIVSTSNEAGEGEHKIYQYIRDNKEYHKETRTAIYGLDADLIMLSLNHLRITPELYLYRETPHFIQSIDKTLNPEQAYLLNINQLAKYITMELNDNKEPKQEFEVNRLYDYIFMCFLLGNDFIPHFPSLNIRTNGIKYLMDAYIKTISSCGKNLTDGFNINWPNFRLLIQHLADRENEYLLQEYRIREKWQKNVEMNNHNLNESEDIDKNFQEMPLHYRAKELYIDPRNKYWENRYYNTLFDVKHEDVSQVCLNYLESLEWTMKYYTHGCPDWRWSYQYYYSPLLSDLIKYIPYFDNTFIKKNNNGPITPKVQLSYVLPKSSLNLLPQSLKKKLLKEYGEIYNENYQFEWSFCKYFWESHAIMPHININKLEKIVVGN